MSENVVLDREMIENLRMILGEKFGRLTTTYISDCEQRVTRLHDAIKSGDFSAIVQESHGLKGSSRNIGANALADLCAQVEEKSKRGESEGLPMLFAGVQKNFAAVSNALRSL